MTRTALAPLLLALLHLGLPAAARAQVDSTQWEDPTLDAAARDADLIVLAEALAVAKNGAAYKVVRTLKGPKRDGATLAIRGLHHPELRDKPPVDAGDVCYLLLRGKPEGEGFSLPTPTFGRFPLQIGSDGAPQAVLSFGGDETFLRVALPTKLTEQLLQGLGAPGEPGAALRRALSEQARASLMQLPEEAAAGGRAAELWAEHAYVALRLLALCAAKDERELVPLVLRVLAHKAVLGPRRYQVRLACVRLLGHLGGKVPAQRLLAILRDDEHPAVRSVAVAELARVLEDKPGTRAYEHVVKVLADVAEQAPARPFTLGGIEDPRTNKIDGPLGACLRALAQLHADSGVRPALRALEREDLDAIVAGLAYFAALKDPSHVGGIAQRMRDKDGPDAFVNRLFARTLEDLTGEKLGVDREPWLQWWRKKTLGPGKKGEGPQDGGGKGE